MIHHKNLLNKVPNAPCGVGSQYGKDGIDLVKFLMHRVELEVVGLYLVHIPIQFKFLMHRVELEAMLYRSVQVCICRRKRFLMHRVELEVIDQDRFGKIMQVPNAPCGVGSNDPPGNLILGPGDVPNAPCGVGR
jgi:hypothetical protein